MEVRKLSYNIKMAADQYVNFGFWSGSTLKGAISEALRSKGFNEAYKRLFETSVSGDPNLVANPFTIDGHFNSDEVVGKTVTFGMTFYGDACDHANQVIEAIQIIHYNNYFDDTLVELRLVNQSVVTDTTIDLNEIYKEIPNKVDETIRIHFDTPFVNKNFLDNPVRSFIRSCTTRVTGMVNSLNIDHTVKFQEFIDEVDKVSLVGYDYTRTAWRRYSNRTMKNHTVYGYLGYIDISGDLTKLYSLIKTVENMGVGKSTLMGFGKFTIERLEETV